MDQIYLTMLLIWVASSLLFLFLVYTMKNGNRQRTIAFLFRSGSPKRKQKALVKNFMRDLRKRSLRPKWIMVIAPLCIMLLLVFLLLNNSVYFVVVTSDSMTPTFKKGDMVLMTKHGDIEEGDIIIFNTTERGALPTLHRVESIVGGNITTKGDFNPVEDLSTIVEEDVHGEAVTIGGDPIVLKGTGTYFIDETAPSADGYAGEIGVTRLLLSTMKSWAVAIFFVAVALYIIISVKEVKARKV